MKLIKTSKKYTYEIESDYKPGDEISFTDKTTMEGNNGLVIGLISKEDSTDYLVRYNPKIIGGYRNSVLIEMPSIINSFTTEQIRLKY